MELVLFRNYSNHAQEMFQFRTAYFWAEKAATLSKNLPGDIYMMAKSLYLGREFKRAAFLLVNCNIYKTSPACFHLLMKAYDAAEDYMSMECYFEMVDVQKLLEERDTWFSGSIEQVQSGILFLRAKCEIYLGRRQAAAESLFEALRRDPTSVEVMDVLLDSHLCSKAKLLELLQSLESGGKLQESEVVYSLLTERLRGNPKDDDSPVLLSSSSDVIANEAERLLQVCDYKEALEASKEVLSRDRLHPRILLVCILSMVEMKKKNDLFLLAHQLIDMDSHSHISWFAVGCYYFLIGKSDVSRRYLQKSIALDPNFGLAMLVQGHSFASDGHHDQAMASYFKAAKLMPNCHLPTLYVGVEYGLTNNLVFAEKFFDEAHRMGVQDPFVIHELGFICYQKGEYKKAEIYFLNAVKEINSENHTCIPETWEPLFNNLGNVCRKLGKYEESLRYHRRALLLKPRNGSTYTAIGLVQALRRDYQGACDSLHKALSFKRDDSLATSMLNMVLEILTEEPLTIEGIGEVPSTSKLASGNVIAPSQSSSDSTVEFCADDGDMDMSGC